MSGLVLHLWLGAVAAQTKSANYTFVLASGFLCDQSDSGGCPAVAKSGKGDTYEIGGAGTFDPQNRLVKAAGTFNHRATNGNVLETGVWIASDLVSFASYGAAPAARMNNAALFRRSQIGAARLPVRSGASPTGGLAVFRILLIPMLGAAKAAVLEANCALGDVPRERSVEGIRLSTETDAGEFSEEVSGRVLFFRCGGNCRAQH